MAPSPALFDRSPGGSPRDRDAPSSVTTYLFPLAQLAAGGVALGAWWVVDVVLPASERSVATAVFAWSTLVSLVLTLGVPVVLPNLVRGERLEAPLGVGPWSGPLALMRLICGAAVVGSCVLVGASIVAETSATPALVLASAGLLASGLLLTQMGRVAGALRYVCAGTFVNVVAPAIFLASTLFSGSVGVGSEATTTVIFVAVHAFIAVAVWRTVSVRFHVGGLWASNAVRSMRGAISLVPHMLCFAALVQGPRLIATVRDVDGESLSQIHRVMLVLGGSVTVMSAANAMWASTVQLVSDARYLTLTRQLAWRYGLASGVLAVIVAVGLGLVGTHVGIGAGTAALTGVLVVAGFGAYFSASGHLLRAERMGTFSLVSASTLAIYWLGSGAVGDGSGAQLTYFALCIQLLAVLVLMQLWRLRVEAGQVRVARILAGRVLFGYLPLAVFAVFAVVLLGTRVV